MADYATPTVVLPVIPNKDMTPLEKLLLALIFAVKDNGSESYFYADTGPAECAWVARDQLQSIALHSIDTSSWAANEIRRQVSLAPNDEAEVELDLTRTPFTSLFQNIIRRSDSLRYVALISSFTCTKMRPDGFGGKVALVTAERIRRKTTFDILEEFLVEAGLDQRYDPLMEPHNE